MKKNKKVLIAMYSILLVVLVACGNSTTKNNTIDIANNTNQNNQGNTSNNINSNNEESIKSSNKDGEITKSKKDEYLEKLNKMEESDRNGEAKTTMVDMVEQETERYKTWDEKLNEIYGVLKEQLSTEQIDKLKKEQRYWIKRRDEVAKEESIKYKGGSMESLEYVATQASLTRERCYELVANYMK